MKTAIILLLLAATAQAADITTTDGKVYKDARIVGHDAVTATIMYADGGSKVEIAKLSPELQRQLGYEPAKAETALAERAKDTATAEKAAQVAKLRAGFLDHAFPGAAEDIEVVEHGIIGDAEYGRYDKVWGPSPTYLGRVFIECDTAGLIDGAQWKGPLWPVGTFSYTTVSGARSTIPKFTSNVDAAIQYFASHKNTPSNQTMPQAGYGL